MTLTRYDRRAIVRAVDAVDAVEPGGVQIVGLVTDDTPQEFRDVPRAWFELILRECLSGNIPSFDAFPGLALNQRTPPSDPRWKVYNYLVSQLTELPIVVPADGVRQFTALQMVSDGDVVYIAANGLVEGCFWVWIDGRPHLDIGVEIHDRYNRSHVTVLHGSVNGELGAMVFWHITPSIIRAATPDRLRDMLSRSIGVPAARKRWAKLQPAIDFDDIRSALFEADAVGVHPEATGSKIVDLLEAGHRAGGPSRRAKAELVSFDEAADVGAEGSPTTDLADHMGDADLVVRVRESLEADDRRLSDAMLADPGAPLREVARTNGWAYHDVDASFKRIQRKARKLTKPS